MISLIEIFKILRKSNTPTEIDWKSIFSSVWHKSEKLPIDQILGLAEEIAKATTNFKGYHTNDAALKAAYPKADNKKDFFAWVGSKPTLVWKVYANGEDWENTGDEPTEQEIDLAEYAKTETESGVVVRTADGKIEFPITQGITEDKEKAPSNFAVKEFEKKVFSDVKLEERIPYSLSNDHFSASTTYWYAYKNQDGIKNLPIKQLKFNIKRAGTMTIVLVNVKSNVSVVYEKLELDRVGIFTHDVNIKLSDDERLCFLDKGDTAQIGAIKDAANSIGGTMLYYDSLSSTWKELNYNMCIGVVVDVSKEATKIDYVDRTINKDITDKGVIRNSTDNFIATINVAGFVVVDIRVITTGGGGGGAFFDAQGKYISGYTFTVAEASYGERKIIPIPANAITLTFTYGMDSLLEPLGYPIFDYVLLNKTIMIPTIEERIIALEESNDFSNIKGNVNADTPIQIYNVGNLIYKDIQSNISSINSSIVIHLLESVYTDKIYLNGSVKDDFDLSFNFEIEDKNEETTKIAFVLECENGKLITISRSGRFKLIVKDDAQTLTSNVGFESTIRVKLEGAILTINVSDKEFTINDVTLSNAYYQANANNKETRYFINNFKGGLSPHTFETLGLFFPTIASCRINEYALFAFYLPDTTLGVGRVNLLTKERETINITSVKLHNDGWIDSHNYWTIGVDSSGGVHVMGNCHATQLYYLYGSDYLDLTTIAVSDKLSEPRATYPDLLRNDNGFFATYRIGYSGNSINVAFKFNQNTKLFERTTDKPFADGTGGKGGTAYFGKWIEHDNWFYNAWCWRTSGYVETNNQVNLIKTKDFAEFYSVDDIRVPIPMSKSANPVYCIDNVPENSGLVNQWYIIPFVFNKKTHAWYMKNDEKGCSNIYLVYPTSKGYETKKVTNFNYHWRFYGLGTIDVTVLQVAVVDNDDMLSMHIKHLYCGDFTYSIDKNYNISSSPLTLEEFKVNTDRFMTYEIKKGTPISHETDRSYFDRMMPIKNGVIRV